MPSPVLDALVPSGYRFVPTDLELVKDYLLKKITNQPLPSDAAVFEYDVYSTEPWNLPVNNNDTVASNKRTRYYFVSRENKDNALDEMSRNRVVKYRDGTSNRRGGQWKRKQMGRHNMCVRNERKRILGVKKSFAFYYNTTTATTSTTTATNNNDGENNNVQTSWVMHEYTINSPRFQSWVLCTIINNGSDNNDYNNNNNQRRYRPLYIQDPIAAEFADECALDMMREFSREFSDECALDMMREYSREFSSNFN